MAEGDLDPDLEDDLGLEGDPGLDLKTVPEDDPGLLLEDDLAHALVGECHEGSVVGAEGADLLAESTVGVGNGAKEA